MRVSDQIPFSFLCGSCLLWFTSVKFHSPLFIKMVCSIGSVKMAVMARLLAAGSFSQTMTEEVGHQKLVAQYIHRELNEADEANLLDEEDMHVFDLKPMTDPLHLVCCNACRKPVKASQYAAHAELCRSLSSLEELFPEPNGGTGNKKARRKDRKKSISANNPISVTFVAMEDTSPASPGKSCNSAAVLMPPTKRSKLIAADIVQPLVGIVAADSVSNIISSEKTVSYVPAPLATKVYYSQRNNRLRAAISHMYYNTPASGRCCGMTSPKTLETDVAASRGFSTKTVPHDEYHEHAEKGYSQFSPAAQNPDQMFVRNLEVGLGRSRGCQQPNDYLIQSPSNDVASQTPPAGTTISRYISKPHSFTGTSLATMQRSNGRVPVV
ncbi:hypothetical protein Ancab_013516 [Ancistrocladus abbreviatus]